MKAVCIRTCKVMIQGRSRFVKKGDVVNLEEEHRCFRSLEPTPTQPEPEPIDILKASEEELKEGDWKFKDAYEVIMSELGVKLEKGTKKEVIQQIMDARYRAIDLPKDND